MKRSKPLVRRAALQSRTPLERRSELRRVPLQRGTPIRSTRSTSNNAGRRRDAQWRDLVYQLRGRYCRSCGGGVDVQVDHMIPRSPATRWEPCNGLPLCGDFGGGRCHPRKTAHQLLIQRGWLDPDQIEWLRASGLAEWLPDGSVTGRHCRIFAPTERTDTEVVR